MCSKLVLVALLAVAVSAAPHQSHHDIATSYSQIKQETSGGHHSHHVEIHGHPKYKYKYGVEDSKTGDIKHAQEQRDGDDVVGAYSVVQPDGRTRVVTYKADKHTGFEADVKYIGEAHHPETHNEHKIEIEHHGWESQGHENQWDNQGEHWGHGGEWESHNDW